MTIQRGAYYMSNWDPTVAAVRRGILPSMFPADFVLPMVAPADLGRKAAAQLRRGPEHSGAISIEGPARYTPQDVAIVFAASLGCRVTVAVTPREDWMNTFQKLGFSEEAAHSFASMTAVTLDGGADRSSNAKHGRTTLAEYVDNLVGRTNTN